MVCAKRQLAYFITRPQTSIFMEKTDLQKINEICESLKSVSTIEDFVLIQGLICNIFSKKTPEEINLILANKDNFYITAFENVFNNPAFIEAVSKVLEQYKNFQKNYESNSGKTFVDSFNEIEIRNKKLIFVSLITSLMFLSNVLPNLSQRNILYAATRLRISIGRLKDNFNEKSSSPEIFHVISGVFNKKFYPKIKFPFKIFDLNHLFQRQKISSYLILLAMMRSFRGGCLNSLFESIERSKASGKFSTWTINRLSSFIKETAEEEDWSKKTLSPLIGNDVLEKFVDSFRNDSNEENAFNLIEITLREFKSPKTIKEDIIKTIDTASDIAKDLKNYSAKKFKAFSGNITEDNNEWSNKIFINCCKLLGAVGALSSAMDAAWQIDAYIREFADWTSSIHKILNKYDIEDDWGRVSKYLNQETNKVEWKGTFFTPINIDKNDPQYNKISASIFHGIIKTLLGMLNSDGGVILVGVVEKPEDIINKEIKEKLIEKNNKFFLDIAEELSSNKIDLDGIKRKIQDSLKNETLISIDNFNNLWEIQAINIKSRENNKSISIYLIEVLRSEKVMFSVKSEAESDNSDIKTIKSEIIWVSLLKRADARTIRVDPRGYLTS